jgi:two-component system, OmpR family, sensor histidine kinase QseC
MRITTTSIKQFLIVSLLAIFILSFAMMFFINRHLTTIEIHELYDAQLAQTSRMLQGFVEHPSAEIDFAHLNIALQDAAKAYSGMLDDGRTDEGHSYEAKLAIQIWDDHGQLLLKTPSAPDYALAPLTAGYSVAHYNDFDWFVFNRHIDRNGVWIIMAERADVRGELIDNISISSFGGLICAALLMGLSLIFIVSRGLRPLTLLSAQLAERHIDKLEPVNLGQHQALELKPLVHAIDNLMARVAQDLERERRFLGDVAHELRTPLAALKLHAQMGLSATDLSGTQHHLLKVLQGVDRSTRLVEQLLTLARLDPRALGAIESFNPGDLAQELQQHLSGDGLLANHQLVIAPEVFRLQLQGYPILIGVMLRNLIENACRYSPALSPITINGSGDEQGRICLQVTDQGPGVSSDKLASLCNRFYREHPADRNGSGLGLSIVARIAELHAAQVSFSNRQPQGLEVSILFKPQSA